jgi:formate/nitrite transporter FocA (FNT family)
VWLKLARLWALVLSANVVGCAIVAFVLAATPVIPSADHGAFAFGQVVADHVKADGKSTRPRRSKTGALARNRDVV